MTRRDQFFNKLSKHLWRWLGAFVATFVLIAAIRSVVADYSEVPSTSMTPAILPGDRIYVNKLAYDLKMPFTTLHMMTWAEPKRGDVVVLNSPHDGTPLVKRIAAVPGDRIEGQGEVVPSGKYYVRGDNTDHSFDSRYFGYVDRSQILGRAVCVIVSFDPSHYSMPRWGRFFACLS